MALAVVMVAMSFTGWPLFAQEMEANMNERDPFIMMYDSDSSSFPGLRQCKVISVKGEQP